MQEKYYKPSWKFNPLSLLFFVIFGIIGVIILAIIYSLANRFNPLLYLQFLWVIVWWWLIICLIDKLVYIFKIRSKVVIYLFWFFMILLSLYIHWSIYTSFTLNMTGGDSFGSGSHKMGITYISTDFVKVISDILGVLISPSVIIENMKWIFDNGVWAIWSSTVKWRFIIAIWALEAGVIWVYSLLSMSDQVNYPFSENSKKWFDEKVSGKLKMPLDIKSEKDLEMIKQELENWSYHFVKQLKKWWLDISEYCELKLYTLADDADNAYISINNVYETINSKWEIDKEEKEIVKYLSIPYSLADDLAREYC